MGPIAIMILVAGILVVNLIVWVALLGWLRGRMRRAEGEVRAMVSGDEKIVLEPTSGVYRGATERYGQVKGNAVIALTDRRLICKKIVGALVEVPLAEVVEVREEKWFLRSYNSLQHIVVKLRDGVEVGFQVRDADRPRWIEALKSRVAR